MIILSTPTLHICWASLSKQHKSFVSKIIDHYLFTSHFNTSATNGKLGFLKFSMDMRRTYPSPLIISVKSTIKFKNVFLKRYVYKLTLLQMNEIFGKKNCWMILFVSVAKLVLWLILMNDNNDIRNLWTLNINVWSTTHYTLHLCVLWLATDSALGLHRTVFCLGRSMLDDLNIISQRVLQHIFIGLLLKSGH